VADLITLADYETAAAQCLDANAFGYYSAGADDQRTLADNPAAYGRIKLLPRVLCGVGTPDLSTTVLGTRVSLPVLIAPMAMQGMAHAEAEAGTARAAREADTVMVLSTISNTAIEDVIAAREGPVWFQLYIYRDRAACAALVRRAEAAGCSALVVTVDAPVIGQRESDIRNRFAMPAHLSLPNVLDTGAPMTTAGEGPQSALNAYAHHQLDPLIQWSDIDWLRDITSMPIVLKGILHPNDARMALARGASGIIVSNHGGRQLDTVPATIEALPAVLDAVGADCEVYVDGGVRRGTDVLKALALGARAVLLGRPILYGLAVDGSAGAAQVLAILRAELERAMVLTGCASRSDVGPELIWSGT
jgi:4-hydroxymandelate oxidase